MQQDSDPEPASLSQSQSLQAKVHTLEYSEVIPHTEHREKHALASESCAILISFISFCEYIFLYPLICLSEFSFVNCI